MQRNQTVDAAERRRLARRSIDWDKPIELERCIERGCGSVNYDARTTGDEYLGGDGMAMASRAAQREEEVVAVSDQGEVDKLMRRFFSQNQIRSLDTVSAESVSVAAQDAPPRRDFDMASDLLDRASQAFDLLIDRCQRLERDSETANQRAMAQAAEQDGVIEQWKRLATGLKAQLDAAEGEVSAMKQRFEAAEARATRAEQRATALERVSAQAATHATTADQLSTKLHDKVVAAFGIGSRAHPVLEAVATQIAVA